MTTINLDSLLEGAKVGWDDTAMSGTAKRVSEWLPLGPDVSNASWMIDWANGANVAGSFGCEISNDGVTAITKTITSPSVSNNNGPGYVEISTSAKFVRLTYTNSSGTGTLGALIAQGKRR